MRIISTVRRHLPPSNLLFGPLWLIFWARSQKCLMVNLCVWFVLHDLLCALSGIPNYRSAAINKRSLISPQFSDDRDWITKAGAREMTRSVLPPGGEILKFCCLKVTTPWHLRWNVGCVPGCVAGWGGCVYSNMNIHYLEVVAAYHLWLGTFFSPSTGFITSRVGSFSVWIKHLCAFIALYVVCSIFIYLNWYILVMHLIKEQLRELTTSSVIVIIQYIHGNVYVYSVISPWVQQTSQFTLQVLELSLIRYHLLWG